MVVLLAVMFWNPGPDTDVLIISEGCAPCVKAIEIIERLQAEGYDVVILKAGSGFETRATPTLLVRTNGKIVKRIVGLQTEAEYRKLINCPVDWTCIACGTKGSMMPDLIYGGLICTECGYRSEAEKQHGNL